MQMWYSTDKNRLFRYFLFVMLVVVLLYSIEEAHLENVFFKIH